MTNPVPGYSVTTPYGKEGSAWSCGWHDGADFAAPAGTPVVAMIGGTVVEAAYPTSFGSAFGRAVVIDHDSLPDGSPGLWGLYAHLSKITINPGQRVETGQKIGEVGTTGNSTGNHLHAGIYAQPSWAKCGGKNPQPWIDAGVIEHGQVRLSQLVYGQHDSDDVRRLQLHLNAHPLVDGQDLPISGNYLEQTDHEVRLCQGQHGYGNDPQGGSSVGPKQAAHLISGCACTIVDDREPEEPPDPAEPPTTITLPLGIQYHYSGKPAGTLSFGGTYKKLDVDRWAPKAAGVTFGMIYLNVDGPGGEFRSRLIRDPDDGTAYQTHYPKSGDNYLTTHVWFESGEADRDLWYELATMDGETLTAGTRYAKFLSIPWEVVIAVTELAAAYMLVRPVLRQALGELGIELPDVEQIIRQAAAAR